MRKFAYRSFLTYNITDATCILLTMCGTALNLFATVTWAFVDSAHGSLWLLLLAFLGLLGSTIAIIRCRPGYVDPEIVPLLIACSSISPLVATGCWLLSPDTLNSNWVLALFLLSSVGPIYGCKKLGARLSNR